jgi:hypothetical protein
MYSLGDHHAVKAWQFIFVLMGPVTVVAGLYIAFAMPSSPATAWFLTPEERLIALERIRRNKTGTHVTVYKPSQLLEAIKDPRMYLAAISVFCASVQNGGVSSFGATIIAGFGFTTKETTLLGMTTGGSEIVAFIVGVMLSRWWKMRGECSHCRQLKANIQPCPLLCVSAWPLLARPLWLAQSRAALSSSATASSSGAPSVSSCALSKPLPSSFGKQH